MSFFEEDIEFNFEGLDNESNSKFDLKMAKLLEMTNEAGNIRKEYRGA